MSMKRILGMMLASRMAGRGMRGGIGGGLGGLAAGGLLGGHRGGMGRKAGLAALGYMAYRAYQDHQARTDGGVPGSGTRSQGHMSSYGDNQGQAGSNGGLIGGIMKSVSAALSGQQGAQPGSSPQNGSRATGIRTDAPVSAKETFTPEDRHAAENFSEDKALLLVRAMVTAANADGSISSEERSRIMAQADEAGADAGDRQALELELSNPRRLDELLGQVQDPATAEEFYLASRMAIDHTTEAHQAYLARLRDRLGLGEQEASEIEILAK